VSNAGQSAPPQRLMLTASPHAGDAIEIDNAMLWCDDDVV
jgi:hypothetical protein